MNSCSFHFSFGGAIPATDVIGGIGIRINRKPERRAALTTGQGTGAIWVAPLAACCYFSLSGAVASTTMSTRRFWARPSAVSLPAAG